MAHKTRRRMLKAKARLRSELETNPPYVCPGCYAVGDEPCLPGCIDNEIEQERLHPLDDYNYAYDPSEDY